MELTTHTIPLAGDDPRLLDASTQLGPCTVRVMDSTQDHFPDLLSAMRFAAHVVDTSAVSRMATGPLFAVVYDRKGRAATFRSRICIEGEEFEA